MPKSGKGPPWGLFPLAVLLFLAGALPFFVAIRDSFFHDIYGQRSFAGWGNYRFLAGDRAFALSFGISALWAALQSFLVTVAGYSLAVFMFEERRLKGLAYAALLVPWGIPAIISLPLWRMIIHGAGGDSILAALFGIRVNLLTDGAPSFCAALLVATWMRLPAAVFVLYGALSKLPRRLIDAARLDGAGRAVISTHIYWPLVRGSALAVFALEFASGFKEFSVPFLLTGGGPPLLAGITDRTIVGATTTLEVYLYDLFQGGEDYGLAAAYAAIAGLAVALLTSLALLVGGKSQKESTSSRKSEKRRKLASAASRYLFPWRRATCTGRRPPLIRRRGHTPELCSRGRPFRVPGQGYFADGAALFLRSFLALAAGSSALLLIFALVRTAFSGLSSTYIDSFLPPYPTLANFPAIFTEDGVGRNFANTLVVAVVTALICPFLILPAALHLRHFRVEKRAFAFGLVQALGAAGGMHSLVPLYGIFRGLGLVDSYVPVVFVYLFHAAPFALFIATAFLEGLPPSLEESAEIEGAGRGRIFFSILFPLSLPVAVTAAMCAFLAAWNGFLVPLLFLNDDAKYTIAIRLYTYVGSLASGAPKWNRFAAASLVNLLVVALVLWRLKGPLGRAPTSEYEE